MRSIISFIISFLPHRIRREIKELYLSTLILNFGVAMILIFEPIYLYTIGLSLQRIVLFFILVYVLYLFIMPFGAMFARRFGYERSMAVSTFIYIAYYFVFYNIADAPALFYLAPLLYALQKTFYWPAYHADFARNADYHEDAREIASIDILVAVVAVVAPIVAGLILEFFGFAVLFAVASAVFLLSNLPLMSSKEVFTPKPYHYWQSYKDLLAKDTLKYFFGYLGYGEEAIVLVLWPIFMVIVVGDLLNLGLIVAAAMLVTVLVALYVGKSADKGKKRVFLRLGTLIYSLVWFTRTIVSSVVGVLLVDTLSRVSKEVISLPVVAMTYERAQQRSIMRTLVFYEMSLAVGKLLALSLVFLLLFFIPGSAGLPIVFIIAGLMTFFYRLLL